MKTLRIIGEDTEFIDNWGINSNDVGGVRIRGNYVQRLSKNGAWIDCYNAGKPIEKILWCENGQVMAVTGDGSVQSANVNLTCNPANKPQAKDYVIEDAAQADKSKGSKRESNQKEKSGKKFLPEGWWYKYPLKGLWKLIKFIFVGLLFGAMTSSGKNK